ncbi:Ala-tRNA(Pro) hydrolase [Limimonas halophila]|uniref:Alanine--tRNA ligase n=1 Tax=Limimonas halophila TaxID=1082479 RepID=A0A1G7NGH7_9PROT|nr:alanyl-tRNA editing protein [Limimonas halophila]SDF72409.1 Ala-tRNA(Pro) hydrolase [Limimonas halophila]
MTAQPAFRADAHADRCTAEVVSVGEDGIRLSDTVFYPEGGGQPGDTGWLTWDGGTTVIRDARKADGPDTVLHVPDAEQPLPPEGAAVTAIIDWPRRHRLMRMHTALHLLCSVIDGDVTGGQIGADKSRLDFNIGSQHPDKEALSEALNRLVAEDHPVRVRSIAADELAAQSELVRTMSVQPPTSGGTVRLVEIEGVDLQPCGGTHVASTGEIGPLRVGKVESKGRQNRRINIHLAEE